MEDNPPTQPEKITELKGDPARQAGPLFRGIDYQIWQTVLAWIDLREDEILVVEGAEDFDTLTQSSATISQVKNLASPISLRSDCVCDALRNFWIARHKNAARHIRFRLITTADFSVEAGAPFGTGKSGLEVWNKEASEGDGQQCHQLKDFLCSDESVSKRLAEPFDGFPLLIDRLRNLSPEAFRTEFVCGIHWLTQQPDIDVVREMVRVKLHAYGEEKHLLARDSERALTPLFARVAHVAFREKRHLTLDDFRVLFDDSTSVSVPISQFKQMQAAMASLQPHLPQMTPMTFAMAEALSIPDLPVPCTMRIDLVDALRKRMVEHGLVAIQGSTGKGKSTLAKLVAQRLGGQWCWVNFAGRESEQISDELYRLAHHAAGQANAPSLLLDDFNPKGSSLPLLLQRLAVLSRLTLGRGGKIIVTTQRILGEAFLRQSNLPPEVLQETTSFSEREVQDLCTLSGCPQDQRLTSWVKIVCIQTGRHPQLVHARVKVASRNDWQLSNINDVLETPKEIADERYLARQLLQELDDGEVEFLFRLSLASEPFRKDQALAVAEIAPPIVRSGEKFDALVGPWIESAGKKYFRLSHLLSRLADENWTSERVRTMRIEYAKAIDRVNGRTLLEVSEILFQAVLTKEAGLAGKVLSALTLAPLKSRKAIAEWLDWILVFSDPSPLFPENHFVCHLFSLVQFRVAVALQKASAPKFAELLFQKSKKPIAADVESYSLIGASTDVIIATQVLIAPSLLLQGWLNIRRVATEDKRFAKLARSIENKWQKGKRVLPKQSFAEFLFSLILNRRGGSNYFRQFITAVDFLSPDDRKQIVSAMKANTFSLLGFVDDIWMEQLRQEKADWGAAIAVLKEAHIAGEQWRLPGLCGMAARGIAAIEDEYLHKSDEALKVLDATAAKFGDSLMLRYQRGTVHFSAKRYSQAYEAWFSTFDDWPADDEIAAVYAFHAYSNCGAAAGFLEKWENSAMAFEKGEALALQVGRKLDVLKFGIDAAYALWRAGQRNRAISKLAKCLSDMEQLSRSDKSTEFHTTWKVMEHITGWFKNDSGAPHDFEVITPRPGICSEAKSKEKHDLVKNAPRASALISWYCLTEAELYAHLGRHIYAKVAARNDLKSYPKLVPIFEFLHARRAVADYNFKLVPIFAESSALASSLIDSKGPTEHTISPRSNPKLIKPPATELARSNVEESLLCALLVASAEEISWDVLLREWRAGVSQMKSPSILTTAIETIEGVCRLTPMEVYRACLSRLAGRFKQVVGGLRLAAHPDSKPPLRYVGLCGLVIDEGFARNMMLSHEALEKLTRKTCLAMLSTPFELNSPRLTVPAIKAACESNKKGLALAATILLAADGAVTVGNMGSTIGQLQKLAGQE